MSLELYNSSSHAVINIEKRSNTRTTSTITPSLHNTSRCTHSLQANDKISYGQVGWVKTHTLKQCPHVKAPGCLLQKQKHDFRAFYKTFWAPESYHYRGRGTSRGIKGYDCRQCDRRDAQKLKATVKQSSSAVVRELKHPKQQAQKYGDCYTHFLPATHLCRQNPRRCSPYWGLSQIRNRRTRPLKWKYR